MKEEKKKKQSWKVDIPIEEYPNDYIEHCKKLYRINEDLVGHLMVWDDIDKVPEFEWMKFWDSVKSEKIRIRKMNPVQYRKKHVNMFEKYSMDELKKIYEDVRIGFITQYFINYLNKYNEHTIIDIDDSRAASWILDGRDIAKNKIQNERYRSKKEEFDLLVKVKACDYLYVLLEEDKDNHSDMYDFVINNLQYASVEDLKSLIKLAKNGFVIKNKGRKSRDKKIFKYDLQHNLLNTYPNRNACIDAEQISKQSLYNVLSGKRKTLKGFIYEEEQ